MSAEYRPSIADVLTGVADAERLLAQARGGKRVMFAERAAPAVEVYAAAGRIAEATILIEEIAASCGGRPGPVARAAVYAVSELWMPCPLPALWQPAPPDTSLTPAGPMRDAYHEGVRLCDIGRFDEGSDELLKAVDLADRAASPTADRSRLTALVYWRGALVTGAYQDHTRAWQLARHGVHAALARLDAKARTGRQPSDAKRYEALAPFADASRIARRSGDLAGTLDVLEDGITRLTYRTGTPQLRQLLGTLLYRKAATLTDIVPPFPGPPLPRRTLFHRHTPPALPGWDEITAIIAQAVELRQAHADDGPLERLQAAQAQVLAATVALRAGHRHAVREKAIAGRRLLGLSGGLGTIERRRADDLLAER